jgi:hypothetical protein
MDATKYVEQVDLTLLKWMHMANVTGDQTEDEE